MARLGLSALALLAALTGVAAQPPACVNVQASLKAPKAVNVGGNAYMVLSVKNTDVAAQSGFIIGLTLPTNFQTPYRSSMHTAFKPLPPSSYLAPSMVWTSVTLPARKTLRFMVKAKMNKCNNFAMTVTFAAAAYKMDSTNTNLVCLTGSNSVVATVKPASRKITACPTPAPGPAGPITLVAQNQAYSGAQPARRRRRLEARQLAPQPNLDACIAACGQELAKPYSVSYAAASGACSCCKTTCGALVIAPGTNTYEVLAPAPGPAPSPAPYTLCNTGQNCVQGSEFGSIASVTACKDKCTTASASNKYFAFNSGEQFCLCSTSLGSCSTDAQWSTYAFNGGTCPPTRV